MDPSEVEATRTPVHKPRVDEPWTHETPVPDASSHETPVPDASSHETPEESRDWATSPQTPWDTWPDLRQQEPSGHADGGRDRFSDSEDEVVEGATIYQRGSTQLSPMPATREQRPVIRPNGEK